MKMKDIGPMEGVPGAPSWNRQYGGTSDLFEEM